MTWLVNVSHSWTFLQVRHLGLLHLKLPTVLSWGYNLDLTKPELLDWLQKPKKEYNYQNELDKAGFQHEMVFGDFKVLIRRTASDKILHNKAFDIAKNSKYDGYPHVYVSTVYKYFDKKTTSSGIKNENMSNKELAKE